MWVLRASWHRLRPILRWLSSVMHVWRTILLKCHLSQLCPDNTSTLAVLAFELVGHPKQRPLDHGAIIAGQVHDTRLDDETTEFDQMPCSPAALHLPCAHVMSRSLCLMPVARRPVAFERRQCRGQALMQFAVTDPVRTRRRAWPTPPSFLHLWFRPMRRARPPVPRPKVYRLLWQLPGRRAATPCESSVPAPCLPAPSVLHHSPVACA